MYYAGLKYYQTITIDYTKVPSSVTDMVVTLTAVNFNNDFKTLGGAKAPLSTGADVRFFSDTNLNTPIPFDIIDFSLNATPANSIIQFTVKVTVSSTVNTVIYVGWGNTSLSLLSKSDTYGAYNVYRSGFALWCPMKDDPDTSHVLDRTTNQRNGTKNAANLPVQGYSNGYINAYQSFLNGSNNWIDFPAFNTGNQFTIFCPFNYTGASAPGFQRLVSNKTIYNAATGFEIVLQSGSTTQLQMRGANASEYIPSIFTNIITDGWETIAANFNGTTATPFLNAVKGTGGTITSVANSASTLTLGNNASHNEAKFNGYLDNIILYVGTLSDAEIIAMQNNQRAPSTFASAGTTRGTGPYWSDHYILSHIR